MQDIKEDDGLELFDLESRLGRDSALAVLRVLEQFEGVLEAKVVNLSYEERMQNVLRLMKENMRFQTRH